MKQIHVPDGMAVCAVGQHVVPVEEMVYASASDGTSAMRVHSVCVKHKGIKPTQPSERPAERASKPSSAAHKRPPPTSDASLPHTSSRPSKYGTCRVGNHQVPIEELIFCPSADLKIEGYRGSLGQCERRYCKKHYRGYYDAQRRYNAKRRAKTNSE